MLTPLPLSGQRLQRANQDGPSKAPENFPSEVLGKTSSKDAEKNGNEVTGEESDEQTEEESIAETGEERGGNHEPVSTLSGLLDV